MKGFDRTWCSHMNDDIEQLVPRPLAAKEWNVTPRTVQRWEKAKLPGFDQGRKINGRVYHPRSRLEAAKAGAAR
jgi:hypothetical protein